MAKSMKKNLCADFEQAMWLLLSEELPRAEMQDWRDHLHVCPHCQKSLNEARQILTIYDKVPNAALDEARYQDALHIAVQAEPKWQALREPMLYWATPLALAAGLALFWLWPRANTESLEWQATAVENRLLLMQDDIYEAESLELSDAPLAIFETNDGVWEMELRSVEREIDNLQLELALSSVNDRE